MHQENQHTDFLSVPRAPVVSHMLHGTDPGDRPVQTLDHCDKLVLTDKRIQFNSLLFVYLYILRPLSMNEPSFLCKFTPVPCTCLFARAFGAQNNHQRSSPITSINTFSGRSILHLKDTHNGRAVRAPVNMGAIHELAQQKTVQDKSAPLTCTRYCLQTMVARWIYNVFSIHCLRKNCFFVWCAVYAARRQISSRNKQELQPHQIRHELIYLHLYLGRG